MHPVRVDFYLLADQAPSGLWLLACRLLTKAYNQRQQVFVYCKDANEACQLDELLWTHDPDSFIPHCIQGSDSADYSPIHIGWEENNQFTVDFSLSFEENLNPVNKISNKTSDSNLSSNSNSNSKDTNCTDRTTSKLNNPKSETTIKSGTILLNLSSQIPQFYPRFQRVVELISNEEEAKAESRKRYAAYRAQQCELYFHQL